MSDISQIALNGVTYNVKDSTARTEVGKKVTATGGDIADTKVSAYTASSASYPVPAAGDTPRVFMGKIKKFFEDIRNATTGACFIGGIINNCVTDNAKLPLSAAQGKALMDLYTKLNSDLGALETNLAISNYTYYPVTSSTTSNAATIKGTGKVISIDGALTAKAGLSIEKWGKTLVGWVPEGTVPTNDVYCYMQDNMYILIDTQRQVWLCNRTAATKDVSNVSYLYSCTYLIQ